MHSRFRKSLSLPILLFQILSLILILFFNGKNMTSAQVFVGFALVLVIFFSNLITVVVMRSDPYLFSIATFLYSIGFVMIYRLNPALGGRHLLWLVIGLIAYYFVFFLMRYVEFFEDKPLLFIVFALFLFAITLVFGKNIHGARNWIVIAGFSFQPSELTKIIFIFLLSSFYKCEEEGKSTNIGKLQGSFLLLIIVYFFIALFFLQKDLGSAMIFFGLYMVYLYIYDKHRILIPLNFILITIGGGLGYLLFDHVKIRVATWIDPWKYVDGIGYQITQSLFAIASGGFFGTGLGLGRPDFIPVAESDFIFAAICEEFGTFAGIGIIMLFLILLYRGIKIALVKEDFFERALAIGVSTMFALQALVMFGGVTKLLPLTGITIPFLSYGGSSLISSFLSLGILNSISMENTNGEER